MSGESALRLHDRLRPADFPAGQTIQANGLADDAWYLIEQGTVRLQAGEGPGAAAVDLGPGESFGERALVGSGALPTAVAVSDVRCQVLLRHAFDRAGRTPTSGCRSWRRPTAGWRRWRWWRCAAAPLWAWRSYGGRWRRARGG